MPLVYIDDSRDPQWCVFSALTIPVNRWRECFEKVQAFRKQLNKDSGVYLRKEFHAVDFTSGRGKVSKNQTIGKWDRAEMFRETLRMITTLPGVKLFNAALPHKKDEQAYEWLMNRIDRNCKPLNTQALIICDQGKEQAYTRLSRRMAVHNPIPSAFGKWVETGDKQKNIPLTYIIEDPFFRDSARSYFIQLSDFCAYALLRLLSPTPRTTQYGLDQAFYLLEPILVKEACKTDPLGLGIVGLWK